MVERSLSMREVEGSIPSISTFFMHTLVHTQNACNLRKSQILFLCST